MIARREEAHHRGRRCEPGGEGEPVFRAFEGGDALFEGRSCGVSRPAVLVALVLARRFLRVGRGLVDGYYGGSRGGVGVLARVYGARGEPALRKLQDSSPKTR